MSQIFQISTLINCMGFCLYLLFKVLLFCGGGGMVAGVVMGECAHRYRQCTRASVREHVKSRCQFETPSYIVPSLIFGALPPTDPQVG